MNSYVYDLEIFPNFFCITFLDLNSQERFVFIMHESKDDSKELINFLSHPMTLYGYNNLSYDGVVLAHILEMAENGIDALALNDAFELSKSLISGGGFFRKVSNVLEYLGIKQIDLMRIMAFDKLGISLKQCAINLRWHRIQDLPLPYNHNVEENEMGIVLDYNLNDVLITQRLYEEILPLIKMRQNLSDLFQADLTSASDSKIANVLLEDFYVKLGGTNLDEIRSLRTMRYQLMLSECFGKNISFYTNKLNRIKNEIGNTIVREKNEFKYSKKIEFGGTVYELGVGGLHSVDEEGVFEQDETYLIRDADVASYYPAIMIINNIIPEHLGSDFTEVLKRITAERLSAKKAKDMPKADGLKITINSIFGKLGSDIFWLFDPKAMLSVTVSGQLYLLMLIEMLVLAGIRVISANTDGIVCKIRRDQQGLYDTICSEWQKNTGFQLEFTDYVLYARTDVNNYVTKKANGDVKTKGRYVTELDEDEYNRTFLRKAYKHPIVPRALFQYFVNNKAVEETIRSSTNILDFCISQKTGKEFVLEYHINDSIIKLQKNNRFYISKKGGKLVKRHLEKGTTIGLYVSQNATVLNDYDESIPFSSYDIDYDFYIEEVNKYVLPIEKSRYEKEEPFVFVDEPPDYTPMEAMSPNEEAIRLKLDGVKNLSGKVLSALVKLDDDYPMGNFFDFMVYAENNSLVSKKFEDLIKINYFSKFGKNKTLLTFFLEFTSGKSKYKSTLSQKSKDKRLEELRKLWESLPEETLSVKEQIDAELAILGRIDSHFDINPRFAYVIGISTKYSPRLQLYSLGTGSQVEVKIQKRFFDVSPIKEGDVIYTQSFEKKPAVKFVDGNFEEDLSKPMVYWLTAYKIVTDYSILEKK